MRLVTLIVTPGTSVQRRFEPKVNPPNRGNLPNIF